MTPPSLSRSRTAGCRFTFDVDLILSINLASDEEGSIDEALAWSKADFAAIEQARHAAEQK